MLEVETETSPGPEFWSRFREFLLTHQNKKTVYDRMIYAKEFAHILLSGDGNAQELLALPKDKRLHAMKGLASLSKFLGKYDEWCQIRKQYQLKWEKEGSLEFFERIYNSEEDLDAMIKWLRQTLQVVPSGFAKVLTFDTLTGLRPDEAFKSIALVNSNKMSDHRTAYYNKGRMTLEHFRFPEKFLRRTKKAYISIANDRVLNIARLADSGLTYQQLRIWLHKRGHQMHMKYCRSIFATFMRQHGIEAETIDVLQGRAPASVLARHYFKPSGMDYTNRVLERIDELEREIAV